MELAQGVEAGSYCWAPEHPVTHPFTLKTAGGVTDLPPEPRGQGRTKRLRTVRQQRIGRCGHCLSTDTTREVLGQNRPGSYASQVQEAVAGATEPVSDEAAHRGPGPGGRQEIDVIRAERGVAHGFDTPHAVGLLHGGD